MHHRKIGLGFLLPSHKNATEAIHPTVGTFDDPAPCFHPRGWRQEWREKLAPSVTTFWELIVEAIRANQKV
jgi:hypothetical protein